MECLLTAGFSEDTRKGPLLRVWEMRGWDSAPAPGVPPQAPQGLPAWSDPLPAVWVRPPSGTLWARQSLGDLHSPFLPYRNRTCLSRRHCILTRSLENAQWMTCRTLTRRLGRVPGDLSSSAPAPHGAGPARGSHSGAPHARARPGGLRGPCSEGFCLPSAVPGWKLGGGEGLAGGHRRGGCREEAVAPGAAPVPASSRPLDTAPRLPLPPPALRSPVTAPRPASRAVADLAATSPAPVRQPVASPGRS